MPRIVVSPATEQVITLMAVPPSTICRIRHTNPPIMLLTLAQRGGWTPPDRIDRILSPAPEIVEALAVNLETGEVVFVNYDVEIMPVGGFITLSNGSRNGL